MGEHNEGGAEQRDHQTSLGRLNRGDIERRE